MKKRGLWLVTAMILVLLTGCKSGDTADKYVGDQITAIKNENTDAFLPLLEEGITEMNALYQLQFPEELKENYLSFLQKAFHSIEFEVGKAKKNGENTFTVQVSYTPLNIADTTKDIRNEFVSTMASPDLTPEVNALLEQSEKALEDAPVYEEETYTTITVKKTEKGFSIEKDEMSEFLSHAFSGYMTPYESVCEILNEYSFLKAYLDASYKGDLTQFMEYTDRTEEEALAWYEDEAFDPPEDLNPAYADRYTAAMKAIFKQCNYTVGIPKKENALYNYTVDVTVTPNTSLLSVVSEWENGTYYSEDEVDRTFIELMEKYAAAPSYGEETVVTVSIDIDFYLWEENEDSDLTKLSDAILPME